MFDIFRSDFQRGEDDKFEKNRVLKLVENVRKVFYKKSDKTSCAVPCIECEKTFFDEKDIQQTSWAVP